MYSPHPMLEMTMIMPNAMHMNSVTKRSTVNMTTMWLMTLANSMTKTSGKNVTRMWPMMMIVEVADDDRLCAGAA